LVVQETTIRYNYDAETELRQTWQKKEQIVYKNTDTITAYAETFLQPFWWVMP
jgi:hypothetical protein